MQFFDRLGTKNLRLTKGSAAGYRDGLYLKSNGGIGMAIAGVEVASWAPQTAGNAPSPRLIQTGNVSPLAAATGTDQVAVNTEGYLAEAQVPFGCKVTGVAVLNGTVVAGNVIVAIYANDGTLVANSALAGTAVAGANVYQRVPLTAPVELAPGTYYVATFFSDNTNRFRAPAFGSFGQAKLTGLVFGTLPAVPVAVPTTFTTNQGAIASLY